MDRMAKKLFFFMKNDPYEDRNGFAPFVPRGDTSAYGPGIIPSFGNMLAECVEDHNSELSELLDQSVWAVAGDTDEDNSPSGYGWRMEERVCAGHRLGK